LNRTKIYNKDYKLLKEDIVSIVLLKNIEQWYY